MKLSAVILTKNEEENIIDCLSAVSFCDEIVIVDDKSEDRTKEIIKDYATGNTKVKLYERELGNSFSAQRNFGIAKTGNDWILFVDADERITKDLSQEILENLSVPEYSGFLIPRVDYMWGKELKHGDPGNTKLLRLFDKRKGSLKGKVHEIWETNGKVGQFINPILHYPHPTISSFLKEINFYSDLRAQELYEAKKKANFILVLLYPKAKFIKTYFLKLGFMDGPAGFVHAMLMSFYSFLVRGKLWLLWNKRESI